LNILCIGDVVGSAGCKYLREKLPNLRRQLDAKVVIVNAENSADGNGVTPASADYLFASGADVLTGGNHTLQRREVYDYLDDNERLLRPDNFYGDLPGSGSCVLDLGFASLRVINLFGCAFLSGAKSPFYHMDELLRRYDERFIIVDLHAEATSEKIAMAHYLDGRVTALFGTHTHVQTADACVFPKGTGYITDLGMTGPIHSVLGVDPQKAIDHLKSPMPIRLETASGPCAMSGVLFTVDDKTGRCLSAEGVRV